MPTALPSPDEISPGTWDTESFLESIPLENRVATKSPTKDVEIRWDDFFGATPFEQTKSCLALVGVFALALRFLPR